MDLANVISDLPVGCERLSALLAFAGQVRLVASVLGLNMHRESDVAFARLSANRAKCIHVNSYLSSTCTLAVTSRWVTLTPTDRVERQPENSISHKITPVASAHAADDLTCAVIADLPHQTQREAVGVAMVVEVIADQF